MSGILDRSISPEMCQRHLEEEGDGQFWEAKPQNPWHLLLPAFSKLLPSCHLDTRGMIMLTMIRIIHEGGETTQEGLWRLS